MFEDMITLLTPNTKKMWLVFSHDGGRNPKPFEILDSSIHVQNVVQGDIGSLVSNRSPYSETPLGPSYQGLLGQTQGSGCTPHSFVIRSNFGLQRLSNRFWWGSCT